MNPNDCQGLDLLEISQTAKHGENVYPGTDDKYLHILIIDHSQLRLVLTNNGTWFPSSSFFL